MPGFFAITTWDFLVDSEVFFYLIAGATKRVTSLNFMFSFAIIVFILLQAAVHSFFSYLFKLCWRKC